MIVSLIVAIDENWGIGKDNRLPWHIPSDLRRFQQLTMGHHIIMGRKTYESIGKNLPGRQTIVLTRNPTIQSKECIIAHSMDEALNFAQKAGEKEVFIIGGGNVFEQVLPIADRIYLTIVHDTFEVDTYFPKIKEHEWVEIETARYPITESNPHSYTFKILVRK